MTDPSAADYVRFSQSLRDAGFRGEAESDLALRLAMSTDNSVYQIRPDLVVAPRDAADVQRVMRVLAQPEFGRIALTPRGGGTGTNGQSLNRGVVLDMRRHMHRLLAVNVEERWADVEPGMVLDQLNEALRPAGLFFAPETSTSTRCTIGGMVGTDASGKGSRVYGKTSDNLLGLEIAHAGGLMDSFGPMPDWAAPMIGMAEAAARAGRAAFVANTPALNRRFTGYDLERACPPGGRFEWWRLFPGSEGTLAPITRIRVKLRRIEAEKRLLIAGFASFRDALAAATPLIAADPTAVEVMDETVQQIADRAGILNRLPPELRSAPGEPVAYVFIELNGDSTDALEGKLAHCARILRDLPGMRSSFLVRDDAEIRALWAVRSAGVGLLGKVDGPARPVAFVEDCVVPPENLAPFIDGFLALLSRHGLGFGIYGHVDVGCLHIRPALNIDDAVDRAKLVAVSDEVFDLTRKFGGIFWGEHGKGVRGAYLREWIGEEAYRALQGVKRAFDPAGRFNPGKLVTERGDVMGIATTPFRPFNAPEGDPMTSAFRCNGNAQCLSYAAAVPMCPSFKASADLRHSPKGRADVLREWHRARQAGTVPAQLESDMLGVMDSCLGCKACAASCPVQVDIPTMRGLFYADYYARRGRPLADRLALLAERQSPLIAALSPVLRPLWPMLVRIGGKVLKARDLPRDLAPSLPRAQRMTRADLLRADHAPGTVLLVQDWFSRLFDGESLKDVSAGLRALGYAPRVLTMRPAGKLAQSLGAQDSFAGLSTRFAALMAEAAQTGLPLIGLDPAFVMQLRQDYAKAGITLPEVLMPQEFLLREMARGRSFPKLSSLQAVKVLNHCTESSADPQTAADWQALFGKLGVRVETPATGCCGMAGLFGHQDRHQSISRKLFAMSWAQHMEGDAPVFATGFSCRCQAERLSGRKVRHPLGLIADMAAEGARP